MLKHKDRLSAVDASFLVQESINSHMHVGAVFIFEGPTITQEELLEQIDARLHMVPRFRQKLAFPPLEAARPIWIDDPNFNLEYHIRNTALPKPGTEDQLRKLTGRIFSQQLDRTKPLWEAWLVHGLEGGRFALISKSHHCLVDGISGVDLTTVLFDTEPVPREVEPPDQQWVPHPEPTGTELITDTVKEGLQLPIKAVRSAVNAVEHPGPATRKVSESLEAIGEVLWAFLNPAPRTPLNVEIGPHRRFEWVRFRLDEFKRIKNAVGGTVNDVVLAVVTGAMRKFLHRRGVRTQGLDLRALVPVSIRAEDERGVLGNRIAAMRGSLPVYVDDPLQRLRLVHESMDGVKESKQALGAEVISGMNDFMPPTLLSQASRLQFSTRLFNLIVTNVPGPQFPLYAMGRELLDVFPGAFLPKQQNVAIAIMSYNGEVNFGLIADYDSMGDVGKLAGYIEESLADLDRAVSEAESEPEAESDAEPENLAEPVAETPTEPRATSQQAGPNSGKKPNETVDELEGFKRPRVK